ncbi:hypothetical protein P167DRAFT_571887 [Morchella conica CCBAS932]|uniref:Uncharacterized protein n=1 Tax=Morchella conica CCBAS932 TaxID=1392247 RepID=A0A3N4L0J8_9PEZI|nr:hypothetical protein P167DRAFT_571887 [Morchella conica CCBAS932]
MSAPTNSPLPDDLVAATESPTCASALEYAEEPTEHIEEHAHVKEHVEDHVEEHVEEPTEHAEELVHAEEHVHIEAPVEEHVKEPTHDQPEEATTICACATGAPPATGVSTASSRESERGKNDTLPRFLKESNKNVCFGSPSAPNKKIVTKISFGFIMGYLILRHPVNALKMWLGSGWLAKNLDHPSGAEDGEDTVNILPSVSLSSPPPEYEGWDKGEREGKNMKMGSSAPYPSYSHQNDG